MEKKLSLEERVQRLEDTREIHNIFGREQHYHTTGKEEKVQQMFALKSPGLKTETANLGVYEGKEGANRLVEFHKGVGADPKGNLVMHPLTTPVLEVAGDGKTAKGVWVAPGIETMKDQDGKLKGAWQWEKYGVDFIKEDGKWKFWHLHAMFGYFYAPYDKSWTEAVRPAGLNVVDLLPEEVKADRPCTHPVWLYNPTAVTELVPVPPEPYETWDESTSYVQ